MVRVGQYLDIGIIIVGWEWGGGGKGSPATSILSWASVCRSWNVPSPGRRACHQRMRRVSGPANPVGRLGVVTAGFEGQANVQINESEDGHYMYTVTVLMDAEELTFIGEGNSDLIDSKAAIE